MNGANVEPTPVAQFEHEYQKRDRQTVEDIRQGIKKFKGNDQGDDHDRNPKQCPDDLLFINTAGQTQIPVVTGAVDSGNAHTYTQAYCQQEADVEVASDK